MKLKLMMIGSILSLITLNGCVPLIAGGVAGYAVSEDMKDGELIDNGK